MTEHEHEAGEDAGGAANLEDWGVPKPERIPRPTYFPAALAFGVTFSLWGFVTSPVVMTVGVVVAVVALAGWIGELRRDET